MRVRRFVPYLAVLCLCSFAASARPAEKTEARTPDAVIEIKPIDEMIADLKYIAGLTGHKNEFSKGEAFINVILGESHGGIDFKRPLGSYGFFGENLMDGSGAILVPITNEKDFLALFEEKLSQKPEKDDDGIYSVNLSFGQLSVPLYFRFHKDYAYLAAQQKAGLAKDKLLDPHKVFQAEHVPGFRAVIHLDRIPEGMKQMAVQAIDAAISKEKEKEQPGETKVQQKAREQGLDEFGKRLGALVQEGGELRLLFNIDRQAGEVKGEFALSGKADSGLATEIHDLAQATSLFAGLSEKDSAMHMLLHVAVPENMRQAFEPAVDEALQKGIKDEKDETKRETAKKVFEALGPTFKGGELDTLVALRGPDDEQHYTGIFGVRVKEGEKIDSTVRELVGKLPERDRKKFHFDAETASDVKIHRVDIQEGMDEHARKVMGDHPLYFAITADRAVAGVGPEGLEAVKEALESEAKSAAPFSLEVAMARLAPLMTHDHPNAVEAAKAAFGDKAGSDRVRFVIEGGKRFSALFSVKAPVITFVSKLQNGGKAKDKDDKDDDDKDK